MNAAVLVRSLAVAMLAVLARAYAAEAADPCVGEAKGALIECRTQCYEDRQLSKDNCLNRDHACMEVCRAQREECRLATGLDAAIAACNQTLYDAKEGCRNDNPEGSPERDQCIDQAQVVAFQCRDAAREAARPALKSCRASFRTCAKSCPPPDPPSEVVDPLQCKIDATAAAQTCRQACREAFQVLKDMCLNRDHVCMEGCRASRDTCIQPVADQLAADVGVCKATRDAAVDDCRQLHGEGTLELDQCIDQAQVVAFQCRDAAREAARPGFEACRQALSDCASGCALVP